MKLAGLLLIASLAGLGAAADPLPCNQQLMESFELDGQPTTLADENLLCPDVKHNCCSYASQINIYKKWIVAGEREHIKRIYDEFAEIFDKVFEDFTEIEQLAKEVQEETASVTGSNCFKIASAISRYKVSSLRNSLHDIIIKAQKFLMTSREGFYCSLCDAEDHAFFNGGRQEFTMDFGFCARMVENTLNYYLFKYKFFVKVSRLYSEFLSKCDLAGKYHRHNFLKNDVKFFKKDKIVGEIESCRRGFDKPGSIPACQDFCSRFNPVKFDEFLEGELDKLFVLHGYLQKRIHWLRDRRARQLALENEGQTKFHKRVLQESSTKVRSAEANEITKFNQEFRTSLVRPIPYAFDDDLTIKYAMHYDEAIMKYSQEVVFNLVDFEGLIEEEGIDFWEDGANSAIDRATTERVFELLNPDLRNGKDLESFLND